MEIEVLRDSKDVLIWLAKSEDNETILEKQLKGIYSEWHQNGYFVSIYRSGEKKLYQNTFDLLAYNKKKNAELKVQKIKREM